MQTASPIVITIGIITTAEERGGAHPGARRRLHRRLWQAGDQRRWQGRRATVVIGEEEEGRGRDEAADKAMHSLILNLVVRIVAACVSPVGGGVEQGEDIPRQGQRREDVGDAGRGLRDRGGQPTP